MLEAKVQSARFAGDIDKLSRPASCNIARVLEHLVLWRLLATATDVSLHCDINALVWLDGYNNAAQWTRWRSHILRKRKTQQYSACNITARTACESVAPHNLKGKHKKLCTKNQTGNTINKASCKAPRETFRCRLQKTTASPSCRDLDTCVLRTSDALGRKSAGSSRTRREGNPKAHTKTRCNVCPNVGAPSDQLAS
eukprot:m.192747 g.192747  ORF g.192747 m.192747 type:complete len:197 (+) comp53669_c0_seq15:276-866(+)